MYIKGFHNQNHEILEDPSEPFVVGQNPYVRMNGSHEVLCVPPASSSTTGSQLAFLNRRCPTIHPSPVLSNTWTASLH